MILMRMEEMLGVMGIGSDKKKREDIGEKMKGKKSKKKKKKIEINLYMSRFKKSFFSRERHFTNYLGKKARSEAINLASNKVLGPVINAPSQWLSRRS